MKSNWKPIDTAPKNGDWIILYYPSYISEKVTPARFVDDPAVGYIWEGVDGYSYPNGEDSPTHWMPLPEPPEVD